MKRIAIFASGNGSNAENIINYFSTKTTVEIVLILTNNKNAYVVERARNHNIPCVIFSARELRETKTVLENLVKHHVDFVVLAGFMLMVPDYILKAFHGKIVNIHPALLPKYGGKGMYGDFVHEAVCKSGDNETGITIHYVNEKYDEGEIIFQARCNIFSEDTPATIAAKVHELEYRYYPEIIEKVILNL